MGKRVKCIDSEYSPFNFGEIYEVEREREDFYYFKEISNGIGGWWKTRFEDVVECKFKIGDIIKPIEEYGGVLRASVTRFVDFDDWDIEIHVTEDDAEKTCDYRLYVDSKYFELAEEPKPEPQYPIIENIAGLKVVFNPPYTIVSEYNACFRAKFEGKAKCYELDTYDKWEGFKVAFDKMKEVKGESQRK